MTTTSSTILDLIGNTPLLKLRGEYQGLLLKLESTNPGGSIKDRAVRKIILAGLSDHSDKLSNGIIEATSGNTGIAAALISAELGYQCTVVIHSKVSEEKINAIRQYGANLIVQEYNTPIDSPDHFTNVARSISMARRMFFIDQFNNPLNPLAHYEGTGPEIWHQTQGKITSLICGIGSGGTISGLSKYLKEKNPKITVIGIEPKGSLYRFSRIHGPRNEREKTITEGVGSSFVPGIVDFSLIDYFWTFKDYEVIKTQKTASRLFGISLGLSSAAALAAATRIPEKLRGETAVVICPDSAERYFSRSPSIFKSMHGN